MLVRRSAKTKQTGSSEDAMADTDKPGDQAHGPPSVAGVLLELRTERIQFITDVMNRVDNFPLGTE